MSRRDRQNLVDALLKASSILLPASLLLGVTSRYAPDGLRNVVAEEGVYR
jgi:hypothetical protein